MSELTPAVLAEAAAELAAFDRARFLKHGNMGASRGLAQKPTRLGVAKPRVPVSRAAPTPPLEVAPLTTVPDLVPCGGRCGRFVGAKTQWCGPCSEARRAPRVCLDCPKPAPNGRRCETCRRRHYAASRPPCPCGAPARIRGVCETCYDRARRERDPVVRAVVRRKWARARKRRTARARAARGVRA